MFADRTRAWLLTEPENGLEDQFRTSGHSLERSSQPPGAAAGFALRA